MCAAVLSNGIARWIMTCWASPIFDADRLRWCGFCGSAPPRVVEGARATNTELNCARTPWMSVVGKEGYGGDPRAAGA